MFDDAHYEKQSQHLTLVRDFNKDNVPEEILNNDILVSPERYKLYMQIKGMVRASTEELVDLTKVHKTNVYTLVQKVIPDFVKVEYGYKKVNGKWNKTFLYTIQERTNIKSYGVSK